MIIIIIKTIIVYESNDNDYNNSNNQILKWQ